MTVSIPAHSTLVREQRLEDGARALTTLPGLDAGLATIALVFALDRNEPETPGELEVLLEWMQRGTQRYSRQELGDAFGALGVTPHLIPMSGGIVFIAQCLDAVRTPILALAREQLYAPRFDHDELQNVLDEFDEDDDASMDDPDEVAARAQRLARWAGSTLAAPSNGTATTRAALTTQSLRALHERLFTRPAIIAAASADAQGWLDDTVAVLTRGRPPRVCDYTPSSRATLTLQPRDLVVAMPTMEHAAVIRVSPGPPADLRALAAAQLHHEALTDGMSAPLMAELRGKHALSYSVSSQLVDRNDLWDQVYEVEPEPGRVDEALRAVEELWAQRELLNAPDLARARAQLATSARLRTIDANEAILTALREDLLRDRPLDWREQLAQLRAQLTLDDVRLAGAQYGHALAPICTIIVGPVDQLPQGYRSDAMSLEEIFDGWPI